MLMQREIPLPPHEVPGGVALRPQLVEDAEALGQLYWDSYPKGVAAVSLEDAVEEMEAVFDGDYGAPVAEASLVAGDSSGALVGCIQTVTGAPWDGAPDGPFVIELFVHPEHRRRGIGTALLAAAGDACVRLGFTSVALNVQDDAAGDAVRLYRSLGFVDVESPAPA